MMFDNIEFYYQQYLNEIERIKFYDKIIQYPTTLVVGFVGAAFYCLNDYFNSSINVDSPTDWIFIITVIVFFICTGFVVYFLTLVFHGFTRRYRFLPFSSELANREVELYKFYLSNNKKTAKKKQKKAAIKKARKEFDKNLKEYYVNFTEVNQRINDKRAVYYYNARTFLFIDLIILIILGVVSLLN